MRWFKLKIIAIPLLFLSQGNFALPPVVKSNSSVITEQPTTAIEARLKFLLEQYNKISELQQTVAILQGKVEQQDHQIAALTRQLKDFYQDLQQRIVNIETKTVSGSNKKAADKPSSTAKAPTTASLTAAVQEKQLYQEGVSLFATQKENSKQKFLTYLKRYPQGSYLISVHYWLGEIYLSQNQYSSAQQHFSTVIKNKSSKHLPDAFFKRGLIYLQQNKKAEARADFKYILRAFPKSQFATLAQQQLALLG